MPKHLSTNPYNAAQIHFAAAAEFYETHGQQDSAIGLLTAGLLAMSVQVARIEFHVMATAHV